MKSSEARHSGKGSQMAGPGLGAKPCAPCNMQRGVPRGEGTPHKERHTRNGPSGMVPDCFAWLYIDVGVGFSQEETPVFAL